MIDAEAIQDAFATRCQQILVARDAGEIHKLQREIKLLLEVMPFARLAIAGQDLLQSSVRPASTCKSKEV